MGKDTKEYIKTTNHGAAKAHITIYPQGSSNQLDYGPNIPGKTRTWTRESYSSNIIYEVRVEVHNDDYNIDKIYRCPGGTHVHFSFSPGAFEKIDFWYT